MNNNKVYSIGGGFPVKVRESVSTRFSGLIEYSATYLTDGNSKFNIGEIIPTTVGSVKVFPAPKVTSTSSSPFEEVEVTGYGKGSASTTRVVYGSELLELSLSKNELDESQDPPINYAWTIYESWRCQTATKYSVLDNSSNNYSEPNTSSLSKNLERRWIVGDPPPNGGANSLTINWNTGIRDIARTNYGEYDEVAVMAGYIPEIS